MVDESVRLLGLCRKQSPTDLGLVAERDVR